MDRAGDIGERGLGFKSHAGLLLKNDSGAISKYDGILIDVLNLVGNLYDYFCTIIQKRNSKNLGHFPMLLST